MACQLYTEQNTTLMGLSFSQEWLCFCDITPCSPVKTADVLEEYMPPYSGRSLSEARMQHEAVVIRAKFWFLTLGS
jgi:hypothetical protein